MSAPPDQTLEQLFARLKNPRTESSTQDPSQQYHPPTVSSPIFSPPAQPTPPIHSADVLSPTAGTPGPDVRTTNLLNLLKFTGGATGASLSAPMQILPSPGSRPESAADLVGALSRNTGEATAASATPATERVLSPSAAQKEYLLNLLSRPKSLAAESRQSSTGSGQPTPSVPSFNEAFSQAPVAAPQPKMSLFSHVNAFDQLHATSPLNRSPRLDMQTATKKIEILKHNRDESSSSAQALESPGPKGAIWSSDSAPAAPSPIAPPPQRQSVSEALGGVADQVDKQVERALAQAQVPGKDEAAPIDAAVTGDNAADEGKVDKKTAGAQNHDVESSWESAEDEEQEQEEVPVYNFPMKPFVCIQIQNPATPRPIRQDNFMTVAQLKKEFDQVDRSLVTATQTHIAYAQAANKKDNAGLRIIRQDTGHHKQVFRNSGERIFNVQFCNSSSDVETILGTGVAGSVYWTSLAKGRADLFMDDNVEGQGFFMHAVATHEEQTSGSPVKTRAKMSSRHPEYFAISRGKHVHLIVPETVKRAEYCDVKTRNVDSEKYLSEHGLRIMTGKAGKDFAFSEDDTVIVSLDKSGRLKFWDIRELTRRALDLSEGPHNPVELSEPIWTFTAAASDTKPDEKPSVSSVTFLDKEKPMTKGSALRYLIIGFKQNHILQLYDLALKKAVQEVRLPHKKDSDGFCSIAYHPRTGIITVCHPTRNSIYFIHLSAPKYNLGAMEQAKFITYLARDDSSGLPKPDSTAIMSGIRELSFAKVGQLRSLDMLRDPVEIQEQDGEDEAQFELYVMHSKGVTGVSIKRRDLGWNKSNAVVKPIDAVESGFAVVRQLDAPPPAPTTAASSDTTSNAEVMAQQQTPTKKPEPAKPAKFETKKAAAVVPTPTTNGAVRTGGEKMVKAVEEPSQPPASEPSTMTPAPLAPKDLPQGHDSALPLRTAEPIVEMPKSSAASTEQLRTLLGEQFDTLYNRIDGDRRVQDAAGAAKQDAMLRLVSSTLTDNVEKSLTRIVSSNLEKELIPHLNKTTTKAIEKKLSETMPQQLNTAIAKEVKASVPNAIQQALKEPQVHRAIVDNVATKVQQQISTLLQQTMLNITTQVAQKAVADLESRTNTQLREAETRRQQDNAKILELSTLVRALSQTIQTMSENQAAFQQQMLKLQQLSGIPKVPNEETVIAARVTDVPPEDNEVRKITQMLVDGQYDDATIEWLQSTHQSELFDQVFIRVNPQYLEHVNPLVALSVSVAITASLTSHIEQRLDWLTLVLRSINLTDPEIRDMAPRIMEVLGQRLQTAYMRIAEVDHTDPSLKRISSVNRLVTEVRRVAG